MYEPIITINNNMKDIMTKLKLTCVPGMSIAHVKTVCWEREEVGRSVCTSTNKDRKTNTNDLILEEEGKTIKIMNGCSSCVCCQRPLP